MEVFKTIVIYIVVISAIIGTTVGYWDKIMNFFKYFSKKNEPEEILFIPTCPNCLCKMKFVKQERYEPDFKNVSYLLALYDNLKRKRTYSCDKCDIVEPVIYTCKSI